MFDQLSKHSTWAAERLQVKSALNPMLWLAAIDIIPSLAAAYLFREQPVALYFIATMAALPIVVACLGFIYFAIFKPEKLQSEEFQLQHQTLLMKQQSGQVITVEDARPSANVAYLPPASDAGVGS